MLGGVQRGVLVGEHLDDETRKGTSGTGGIVDLLVCGAKDAGLPGIVAGHGMFATPHGGSFVLVPDFLKTLARRERGPPEGVLIVVLHFDAAEIEGESGLAVFAAVLRTRSRLHCAFHNLTALERQQACCEIGMLIQNSAGSTDTDAWLARR